MGLYALSCHGNLDLLSDNVSSISSFFTSVSEEFKISEYSQATTIHNFSAYLPKLAGCHNDSPS